MAVPTFSLSIHADYRCRHSGSCCSTSWDVPVEVGVYRTISDALTVGRLRAEQPFLTEPAPPAGMAAVLRRMSGSCVFYERDSHLCAVHRELGAGVLPAACRIFPRIALTDARGTFITLSHYCPTAAAMLFRTDVPLQIVEAPPAFPTGDYEGLNARGEWPPLLKPGVLMDLDSYAMWERRAVGVLASEAAPEEALAALSVEAAERTGDSVEIGSFDAPHAVNIYQQVLACVPDDLKPDPPAGITEAFPAHVQSAWHQFAPVVNRYLASHAFASWMAYQGRGLVSQVRSLEGALAVLMVESALHCGQAGRTLDAELLKESVRSADLLLRHLADRQMLADTWSQRS
jgi:Fe-S-cluster containining protein